MKRNVEQILFYVIPVFCIGLFISSGEKIIPLLENTFVEKYLYMLSYPNSIIFNLSIGYLSGIFIYYLTGYIPAKKRENEQNIITIRLLNHIKSRTNSLFRKILKCSTETEESMNGISAERFKEICKNCNLNAPTGSKKIIRENPYVSADFLLNESLMNDWSFILSHLDEIDNASIYIEPEYYNVCLKIKKCSLSVSIMDLGKHLRNTNLEAWSSQFYDLYKITKEIDVIIKSIEAK